MYFKNTYAGQTQHHSKLSSQQSSSQVKQSSVELQNRQKRSRQIQIGTFSQTHMLVTKICCFWPRWEIKAELNEVSSHWAPSPECSPGSIPPIQICSLHTAGQPSSLSIQTHLHVVIVNRLQRNLIASKAHTKPTWDTGPASHCEALFPMNHGQRWERKARREQNWRERAGGAKPDSVSEVTEPKPSQISRDQSNVCFSILYVSTLQYNECSLDLKLKKAPNKGPKFTHANHQM